MERFAFSLAATADGIPVEVVQHDSKRGLRSELLPIEVPFTCGVGDNAAFDNLQFRFPVCSGSRNAEFQLCMHYATGQDGYFSTLSDPHRSWKIKIYSAR